MQFYDRWKNQIAAQNGYISLLETIHSISREVYLRYWFYETYKGSLDAEYIHLIQPPVEKDLPHLEHLFSLLVAVNGPQEHIESIFETARAYNVAHSTHVESLTSLKDMYRMVGLWKTNWTSVGGHALTHKGGEVQGRLKLRKEACNSLLHDHELFTGTPSPARHMAIKVIKSYRDGEINIFRLIEQLRGNDSVEDPLYLAKALLHHESAFNQRKNIQL